MDIGALLGSVPNDVRTNPDLALSDPISSPRGWLPLIDVWMLGRQSQVFEERDRVTAEKCGARNQVRCQARQNRQVTPRLSDQQGFR